MTTDPDEQELTDRLHRLGAAVSTPAGDPHDDLARGRRRRRRRYAAAAVGGVAAVAVIGVGVSALGVGGDPSADPATGFAASDTPTPAPVPPASMSATPTPLAEGEQPPPKAWLNGGEPSGLSEVPDGALRSDVPLPREFDGAVRPRAWQGDGCAAITEEADLATYRDLVAEHLDPEREHLQPVSNRQGSGGKAGCAAGTKLGWIVPGRSGEAMVEVEVATGWRASGLRHEFADWAALRPSPQGTSSARVAEAGERVGASVTRADGTTVSLIIAPVFGNNSTVPVETIDVTEQQLLDLAADPRFEFP